MRPAMINHPQSNSLGDREFLGFADKSPTSHNIGSARQNLNLSRLQHEAVSREMNMDGTSPRVASLDSEAGFCGG